MNSFPEVKKTVLFLKFKLLLILQRLKSAHSEEACYGVGLHGKMQEPFILHGVCNLLSDKWEFTIIYYL
jgi:hypothetical protein